MISAAGGVVWRSPDHSQLHDGEHAGPLVAVVHRARYDDWSLPKGKAEPGESLLLAGVREVQEETGAAAAVSYRLGRVRYQVDVRGKQEDKQVWYYAMRYLGGEFAPSDEVDEVRWLSPTDAGRLASYPSERKVLDDFATTPVITSTVILVRHAHAGNRNKWHGDDHERPLTKRGWRQAEELGADLTAFAPDRIVTADPLRCVQTIQPLAAQLRIDPETRHWAADSAFAESPWPSMGGLAMLVASGQVCVVSSQGMTIPGLLALADAPVADYETPKSGFWALSFSGTELVHADGYPPDSPDRTSGLPQL
jgi:phosphohistidine phosphatase SixA/8-oxo-dGTP pyrophosphatase MutT (NUDIX family)